jgi:hypothetical protein
MAEMHTAVVTVHLIVLIGLVLFIAFSLRLFWERRHRYPVKARNPFRITLTIVISAASLAFASGILSISNYQLNCLLWGIFDYVLGVNAALIGIGCKVWDLCLSYEAELVKMKLSNFNPDADNPQETSGLSRLFNIAALISKKSFLLKISLGFYLVTNIPFILTVIMYPTLWRPETIYTDAVCRQFSTIMGIGCVVSGLSVAILIALLSRTLKNVQDNYFLKEELKRISFLLIGVSLTWLMKKFIPGLDNVSRESIGFMDILVSESPAFWICYICIYDIARKAKSQHTGFSSRNHGSKANDTSKEKRASFGMQEDIERVLNDDELQKRFADFLCTEFCVEELLFLVAVREFKKHFSQRSSDETRTLADDIYHKFVVETSPLSINISGKHRQDLHEAFKKTPESRIITDTTFEDAYKEVSAMLSMDNLRRFKKQELKGSKITSFPTSPGSIITLA